VSSANPLEGIHVAVNRIEPDRDPFAGPPEEICEARVEQTFVEGARVHHG
jgi:predicted amidohydrolase YtcJ